MKVPKNLDEAIDWVLNNVLGIEKPLKSESESEFEIKSHKSYGQWIRNSWGFWKEDTSLYFWFLSLGIKHPDDMSGIIITSTYRKFHKRDIKLEEQVQYYKDFWEKQGGRWKKEPGT